MRKQSVLNTEQELRDKLDELFALSKNNEINGFEGLLEIALSEPTIITAIHNIKSNHGANTPGTDNVSIRQYLEKPVEEILSFVRETMSFYKPKAVRRKYIPKKNGKMRPLGIPNAIDKIVQECIRIVIEPILEGKMYDYSFGFRPMRSQQNAIGRINTLIRQTGYTWVVEGDIKGFFDNVDHEIMIKSLYQMGIHDKRILAIIKEMLKCGVMSECATNEKGTPQGGIISPLLANVYLTKFDNMVANAWDAKKTKRQYKNKRDRTSELKNTKLIPAYIVRYADDWVILTNTRANAIKWKQLAKDFLSNKLNLELSEEKTKITQVSRKPIEFLGIQIKAIRDKKVKSYKCSYKTISKPEKENLKNKMKEATELVKTLKRVKYQGNAVAIINKANAIIRGLNNYFCITTRVNIIMNAYAKEYATTAFQAMRESKLLHPEWIPACKVANYTALHEEYTTQIPAIKISDGYIGITSPKFVVFKAPKLKNQKETPYTPEGRKLYEGRSKKKTIKARADELLSESYASYIAKGITDTKYNFEFYMNRAYAFNRDKGRCKCCGKELEAYETETHHIDTKLDISKINKVAMLATVCIKCHKAIHNNCELKDYDAKIAKKINGYRDVLKR